MKKAMMLMAEVSRLYKELEAREANVERMKQEGIEGSLLKAQEGHVESVRAEWMRTQNELKELGQQAQA